MSASRIDELACQARLLLASNPLLSKSASLDIVATRNLQKRRFRYGNTLAVVSELPDCAAKVEALADYFPELAHRGYRRVRENPPVAAGPVGSDPYRSSALAAWMDGLQRGLEWYAGGADLQIVSYYLQPDLVAADFSLERHPVRRLACGIGLVPIDSLTKSRMMQPRVAQCLPDYPSSEYPLPDEEDLDRIADHLNRAVALAAEVDPQGCRRLITSLHTFHVGLRRDPLSSFSSSNELPGSAIVVLSKERLRESDLAATAAQLLHEAGHVLLGLYTTSAVASLPGEFQYVSPYKNDLQTLESILHMAYTIPWECAVRMACLSFRVQPEQRAREMAFIIAYAARQIPLIDIAWEGIGRLGGDVLLDLPDIAAIPSWSARVLELVDRLLDEEPPLRRQAHHAERQRVLDRQAWDIGQMLLRDKEPFDPRMGQRTLDGNGDCVRLWYDGRFHVIQRAAYRPTGKDYGRYAETVGEAMEAM